MSSGRHHAHAFSSARMHSSNPQYYSDATSDTIEPEADGGDDGGGTSPAPPPSPPSPPSSLSDDGVSDTSVGGDLSDDSNSTIPSLPEFEHIWHEGYAMGQRLGFACGLAAGPAGDESAAAAAEEAVPKGTPTAMRAQVRSLVRLYVTRGHAVEMQHDAHLHRE